MTERAMVHRRRNNKPQLLSHIIKAVKILKDIKGSSVGPITNLVRSLLNETRVTPKPRNVAMQVKRALKHAVQKGILVHRAGRYRVLKRRTLVPVDSLELINKSTRKTVKKTRRRASSRGRRSRRRHSHNKRRRHSRKRRHMSERSLSEDSASPEPKKRRKRKQKKKSVIFQDQQKNGQNPSKETVSPENNDNTGKNQDTQNEKRTKLSQRPKTPHSRFKDLMDNEQNKPISKQDRPRRRRQRQLPAAEHRSMRRPRSSKPFRAVRGPTDDEEFGPSIPKRTSRTSHEILERQKESSTDLEQPDHDNTSSESLPEDDDDNQERENYLN